MIVALASGDIYERIAAVTVPLMERALGQQVTVLNLADDPWLAKLSLTETLDQPFIFVDVDLVFRKPYAPEPMLQAAADGVFLATIGEYAEDYPHLLPEGLTASRYLTTGIFAAGPAHREVFATARQLYRPGARWEDEIPLNLALAQYHTPVHVLEPQLNRMPTRRYRPRPDDIARHYPRLRGESVECRLARINDAAREAGRRAF